MRGRLVDWHWEGPSVLVLLRSDSQDLLNDKDFSFPLGAPPPCSTMRYQRGIRSHSYPFQRGTRDPTESSDFLAHSPA